MRIELVRANEIINEEWKYPLPPRMRKKLEFWQRVRIGDPFRYEWKFYRGAGKVLSPKKIYGFAKIKNQSVVWEVTGPFGKKWGNAYTGSPQAMQGLLKVVTPVKTNIDETKMAWYAGRWDVANTKTREQLLPQIMELSKLMPAKFKKAPRKLWRGMKIPVSHITRLRKGQRVPMRQTLGSSWTFNKETAKGFTVGGGIVIEKSFTTNEIIMNLDSIMAFFDVYTSRWMKEDEILIHGNGIGAYLDPKKEKIEAYKFSAEDWGLASDALEPIKI